ncbi:MAG TPA: SpoIIE family protein phosphatase, partial [Kofleriaceae bacterium]|nr:SpoIIE family protein phosphatase [Kofleriaceae bacterium]
AAREGEAAREVEVAEAMRLQAAGTRDDALGPWSVVAEYRSAVRTTGAALSTTLLPDGRLALLVTEAQAHGVPAALATAALTGAFAAATSTQAAITVGDLLAGLDVRADGVTRGGEPVAAFVAILDDNAVAWAAAGHPGAALVGPVAGEGELPAGSIRTSEQQRPSVTLLAGDGDTVARGEHPLRGDVMLVVTSTSLRHGDAESWRQTLADQALAGTRLANVLVEQAARVATPAEDLLVVVVRRR